MGGRSNAAGIRAAQAREGERLSSCQSISAALCLPGLLRILFSYLLNATTNSAFYSEVKLPADKAYIDSFMLFPF